VSFTSAALDDNSLWPLPILATNKTTEAEWRAQLK
jgi:hypothetical protein